MIRKGRRDGRRSLALGPLVLKGRCMPPRQSFQSLLVVGLLTTALGGAEPAAAEPEHEPIRLGKLPLLFVDDGQIAAKSGTVRTFHAARTLPEPVIAPERPWERDRVYVYGSVHPDRIRQTRVHFSHGRRLTS